MIRRLRLPMVVMPVWLVVMSCAMPPVAEPDRLTDTFPEAQAELRAAVDTIARDVMTGNIDGLQAMHLPSDKFSKFGPRRFDRQDVASTNASEAAYFSSLSNVTYEARDLKVDVFGEVAVVTYYPQVTFVRDGEPGGGSGRQTLVFLRTTDGWRIVHEHGTPVF